MAPTLVPVESLRVRREVLEGEYEPAISLGNVVLGAAKEFLRVPEEVFKRTYVTENLRTLIVKAIMGLLDIKTYKDPITGKVYTMPDKIIVIPSLFGGGKTHSLLVLYHVINVIAESESPEEAAGKLELLDKTVSKMVEKYWKDLKRLNVKAVVVDGAHKNLAPTPQDNMTVKTLWGYIAEKLGRLDKVSGYDKTVTSPPIEALYELLNGSGAVLMIDEIARYYGRFKEWDELNTFLLNLTELMKTRHVSNVVVVLTLPYDVKTGAVEKVHTAVMDVIARIARRVVTQENVLTIVSPDDLPGVLRKRIFDEDPKKLEELGIAVAEAIEEKLRGRLDDMSKRLLAEFGRFRGEIVKSYPFHPETVKTIQLIHTELSHVLQITRNPLKIAANTVRAIKNGLHKWSGVRHYLIMPFHIPLMCENIIPEVFPVTQPEFQTFKGILETDILKPNPDCKLEIGDKLAAIDRKMVPPMLAASIYIWLRSIAGRGYTKSMEVYPTAYDVFRALVDVETVSKPEWMDVDHILKTLLSTQVYLTASGDKWYYKKIPDIESVCMQIARTITEREVLDKVSTALENGIMAESLGKYAENRPENRPEKPIFERLAVGKPKTKSRVMSRAHVVTIGIGDDPVEKLEEYSRTISKYDPIIVVFTREARESEIERIITRNNIIVLAPDTEKTSETGVRLWDQLISKGKELIACSILSDKKQLREYFKDYEKDELEALEGKAKQKVRSLSAEFLSLVCQIYNRIYIKRGGRLLSDNVLLCGAKNGVDAIADVLSRRGYLPESLSIHDLDTLSSMILGRPLSALPDGASVTAILEGAVNNTGLENMPIITDDLVFEAVANAVRTLEYAVRIIDRGKEELIWKEVYPSITEAVKVYSAYGRDQNESITAAMLVSAFKRGSEIRIVHYKHIVEEWVERIRNTYSKDRTKILKVLDDINGPGKRLEEFIEETFGWVDLLQKYPVFVEEAKVNITLLEKKLDKGHVHLRVKVEPLTYTGAVNVVVVGDNVEVPRGRYTGNIPLTLDIEGRLSNMLKPGRVTVKVYDNDNNLLAEAAYDIKETLKKTEKWVDKESAKELLMKRTVKVKRIVVDDITDAHRIVTRIPNAKISFGIELEDGGEWSMTISGSMLPARLFNRIYMTIRQLQSTGRTRKVEAVIVHDGTPLDETILSELPDKAQLLVEVEEWEGGSS